MQKQTGPITTIMNSGLETLLRVLISVTSTSAGDVAELENS